MMRRNRKSEVGNRKAGGLHRFRRCAFTLLEVILALSLAVGVMGVIAMAINLHANATLHGRAQVAQAQLARAVLNQISEDVRAALPPFQQDFSGALGAAGDAAGDLADLAGGENNSDGNNSGGSGSGANNGQNNSSGQGSSGSGQGSGGSNKSPTGSSNNSSGSGGNTGGAAGGQNSTSGQGAASGDSTSDSTAGASGIAADLPMLIGTPYELQLDVSRLPRVDQYETMMSGSGTLADIPSDVKTVAYYVANVSEAQSGAVSATSSGGATTALVRRSLDRAITRFATQSGDVGGLDTAAEVLATEVVAIQFAYFDGTTWLTEWDTQTMQSLPLAIEILLTIATRTDGSPAQSAIASLTGDSVENVIETTFRHVVHLRGSETTAGGSGASSGTGTEPTADTGASPTGGTQP